MLTDFGAENVRSSPCTCTLPFIERSCSPVAGSWPANSRFRCSMLDWPDRPRAREPAPKNSPGASPEPA